MTDAGELRRITRERDLAVERFVLMCKAMNQCMWDWDMREESVWHSEAIYTVFGIDPTIKSSVELWTSYVHPDDRERVVSEFRNVVATGQSEWTAEYRFVRPNDGAVLEVLDRGYVIFDEGRPIRMVGVCMDVTQQRALERQLRHAQKMQALGQLAGGIAHDFNNMLQVAKLETQMLSATPSASPEVLQHAKEIASSVDRAAGLTRQLLMFSRLEAMRLQPIAIDSKVGELATMLRRVLGENIDLDLELASGGCVVEADSSMLDQVLVNLAVNSRDAMARGGTLSITTSRRAYLERTNHPAGPYVCIEVRDTGSGIPSDVLPHIFDPFFTTKTNGTGLGLATVYGIIEQHLGWIDVDSEPAHGATFRIYLPTRDPHAHDANLTQRAPPKSAGGPPGSETILLVEDDRGVRRALSMLLENHGYKVLAAESGAAALAAWDTAGGRVDLVVTDLMMAGMNGCELAATLAAKRPGVAILVISGHSGDLDPRLTAGCALLHKPFEGESLLAAVRTCIDRGGKRITT